MDRTKRGKNKGKAILFLPLRETGKELAKAILSNWIKDWICHILTNCSTENVQVHRIKTYDVRSLAASWTLQGGFPLQDFLQACALRNHSTFTRFYLKDSIESLMGEHRLSPFIEVQSLVQLVLILIVSTKIRITNLSHLNS